MLDSDRGMDVCIIACYYTYVHVRPEASSDMSVFTITAGCKGVRCPPIFSLSNLNDAGWL